jgi:hypothetical protein
MALGFATRLIGGAGMFFRVVVTPMFVMVRRLAMMMGRFFVLRGGVGVMLA